MSSKELFELYILTNNKSIHTAAVAAKVAEKKSQSKVRKVKFDLHVQQNCQFKFRFTKSQILLLVSEFNLTEIIKSEDGTAFSGTKALCVYLRRLTYPNRLGDINEMFGRDTSQISRIFKWTIKYLDDNFGHLLTSMDLFWLEPNYLQYFSEKIQLAGSPLPWCVGFIDGTVRPMCRPTVDQEVVYNGHKRVHGLKYQSVVTPSGIMTNMYGPIPGRRHDSYLLKESNLVTRLRPKFNRGPNLPPYCIYADPAYKLCREILTPYPTTNITHAQLQFNKAMSSVRQSVEWYFGKIITLFAFLDFKKNLKLRLQPIGLYYRVGALLTNCHSCLNGSITSTYFDADPPTLVQYLRNTG